MNGKVTCAYWYKGRDSDEESDNNRYYAPSLDIDWPADYCGAVDLGLLDNGKLELVEAHHPYACGWYGPSPTCEKYGQFIVEGWKYLQKL